MAHRRASARIATRSSSGIVITSCTARAKLSGSLAWKPRIYRSRPSPSQVYEINRNEVLVRQLTHQSAAHRQVRRCRVAVHLTHERWVSRPQPKSWLAATTHQPSVNHNDQKRGRTMNSTTLIPKCSSTIVFNPMLASPRSSKIREYGSLTKNSTYSCPAIHPHN